MSIPANELRSAIVRNPLVVNTKTPVMEAIAQMIDVRKLGVTGEMRSSCVLVVEGGKILGILTERDVVDLSTQMRSLETLTMQEVMTTPVITLQEAEFTDFDSLIGLLHGQHIRHLPILDDRDRLLGIVTCESLGRMINIELLTISKYQSTLQELKDAEQALKLQRDFNQLIAEISSRFVDISPAQIDAEIDRSLQLIGEATNSDTSYLIKFLITDQADSPLPDGTVSMTHEWSKPQYPRQIELVQNVPLSVFPWANTKLLQREIVNIPRVVDAPIEAAIDKLSWQRFNIVSSLSVPIIQKSVVTGTMGFASFSDVINWDEEIIRLLQVMTQTIANAQQRTQDERDLQESEERLRLALRAANQGLYDLNLQTGEAIVNLEYATMLEYNPATFRETNAKWIERLHPDDREQVAKVYQDYVAGLLPEYKVEFRQLTHTGEWKWILSLGKIVAWDERGNPLRMMGTHTDISDRKKIEAEKLIAEQVRKEAKLLENIFDTLLAGYWDWDLQNNKEYLSPKFKKMFGYEDHELPNSPETWQHLIFGEDLLTVLDSFERHVQSHGDIPFCNEVRYRHKNGSTIWVICSGQVIEWDENNQPLRMIGCHIDISVRKQAELKLMQTSAQLAASNCELEAFAYSVSHDLRSPLRAIDGFSKALLEDYGDKIDADGKNYFDRIRHNIKRMGSLIDDLLSLSRVSRSEIQYGNINLSMLVEEQLNELQIVEPKRQVEIVIAPNIFVSADITLMRMVISNLVQNAWKFTSHHVKAQIEFGVISSENKQDDQFTYFIRDDGAGFDMNYAKMLFGVFQRLHNTNEFAGTGIGLAIVQRAIHQLGGQVWAVGEVEKGATVYFTLPDRSTSSTTNLSIEIGA